MCLGKLMGGVSKNFTGLKKLLRDHKSNILYNLKYKLNGQAYAL